MIKKSWGLRPDWPPPYISIYIYKCFVYFRATSFKTILWKKNKHRNILEVYEECISTLSFNFLVFICCITLLTENYTTIDNGLSYCSHILYLLLKTKSRKKIISVILLIKYEKNGEGGRWRRYTCSYVEFYSYKHFCLYYIRHYKNKNKIIFLTIQSTHNFSKNVHIFVSEYICFISFLRK